jgi:hypothetical protein
MHNIYHCQIVVCLLCDHYSRLYFSFMNTKYCGGMGGSMGDVQASIMLLKWHSVTPLLQTFLKPEEFQY